MTEKNSKEVVHSDAFRRIEEIDHKYVMHSWSIQNEIHPLPIERGLGSYFWDFDGKKYLDFSSQLIFTNLGFQHPKVIKAIQEQVALLTTVAPQYANEARNRAAELIVEKAGPGFSKVFFTNGGADGNENAIRMARVATGKHKILSCYRSYHGNTTSSITASGDPRRWPNEFASGHVHFFGPHSYRSSFFSQTEEEERDRALAHLEEVILFEGPNHIAAILMETVVGGAGILIPPAGYLQGVRDLCNKYGIKWIADEVMCGFGRIGEWFAFQKWEVKPDLIVFAKGVNSGYVPLGGVVVSEEMASTLDGQFFPGGLTYSGHPLACASAVANIEAMVEEKILENAREIGEKIFRPELERLMAKHKIIGDVHGIGVFWAIELVKNRISKEPLSPYGKISPEMKELFAECLRLGFVPYMNFNRLHMCPPCNISETEALEGIATLDQALAIVGRYYQE